MKRHPLRPSPEILKYAISLKRIRFLGRPFAQQDLLHLAALIVLIPEERREIGFSILTGFLLNKYRMPRLRPALEKIPADPERIEHILDTLLVYREVTGNSIGEGRIRTDLVLGIILQVPDGKIYCEHFHRKGISQMARIFHPATLKSARKELRGLFSGSAGKGGYWDEIKGAVKTIDD